jgi:hypothetical protein
VAIVAADNAVKIYGTAGVNHITLGSGADVHLFNFPGNNTITIQSSSSLFTVSRSGAYVTFEGIDSTRLKMPATLDSQTIVFSDKSLTLKINAGSVMLEDQVIDTTSSSIVAAQ